MKKPTHETTGYMLAQTCRLLRTQVHALLGEIGLCGGQQFVLHVLWAEEGITHSELAERLKVSPATVTNMLKRMEKAGLVERRQDAKDQRVSRAYLTDAGLDIRDAVEETWRELERRAFSGFSSEERDSLGQLLIRTQENLLHEAADEGSEG
ncbi:MAG: MarR family transcriptional regulator [Chloroflexi bacterium]|nr:MarR family transcriptional regulator [Chloroflexota bacterium]